MRALRAVMLASLGCSSSATPPSSECGPGTMLQAGECVGVGVTCGAGTHDEQGTCVPDGDAFLIRARAQLVADGHVKQALEAVKKWSG